MMCTTTRSRCLAWIIATPLCLLACSEPAPRAAAPGPARPAADPARQELARRVDLILSIEAFQLPLRDFLTLREHVIAAATEHDVDPLLVLALIKIESGFDPRALSPRGSSGLMQLQPATAAWFAERIGTPWDAEASLFDIGVNLRIGTGYLAYLHRKLGSLDLALEAYKFGPNARELISRQRSEPDAYSRRVLRVHRRYWKTFACRSSSCPGAPEWAIHAGGSELATLCHEAARDCEVL